MTDDDQLFTGDKDERKQIYERLSNKLMVYLAVKKYVKVETELIFVDSYVRYGYHRNALIEDNSDKE